MLVNFQISENFNTSNKAGLNAFGQVHHLPQYAVNPIPNQYIFFSRLNMNVRRALKNSVFKNAVDNPDHRQILCQLLQVLANISSTFNL